MTANGAALAPRYLDYRLPITDHRGADAAPFAK